MSIFSDIKDATGGAAKGKEWYRARLVDSLEPFSGILAVGDIIFYQYAAQTELLPFFDTYPMTLVSDCLLYTSPSPRDGLLSRMPSSA